MNNNGLLKILADDGFSESRVQHGLQIKRQQSSGGVGRYLRP